MANKEELQQILKDAQRSIDEFKTDAKQARGNMGGMLDNLALGMVKLKEALDGLVERINELDAAASTDKSE
jgi:uncharacterized membrane protein